MSCSWGFTTTGGAKGVGESTTSAVVISLVLIFIADFFLSFLCAPPPFGLAASAGVRPFKGCTVIKGGDLKLCSLRTGCRRGIAGSEARAFARRGTKGSKRIRP